MFNQEWYLSWQEIRCVRLQHNAVERDLADSLSGLLSSEVGDQRGEAHAEVWELCQKWLNHWVTFSETVPVQRSNMQQQYLTMVETQSECHVNAALRNLQYN